MHNGNACYSPILTASVVTPTYFVKLDRKNLLTVYNAINRTDYEDVNEIDINTLENAV